MSIEKRKYADRREQNIAAVAKRRKKIKELAIQYKGGKCYFCGYKKYYGAFDFHHINEKEKKFGLSTKGLTRSWDKQEKRLISAFSFAPIVIGNYMLDYCSFQ
ncbi:hypothetical protein COY43_01685 [Candidatus Berkelbacteria bacterium CG_4_10_14_0_8_um_filter_35_9_33_8]|uniref:HNH endonuclease n=1 Tax=Candidatus Berkelbacteria bacterium CG_4_10_14_0_2_um_filter_35_9_33_12 TaxID=1974499 RepID=A0A2M7W4Z0_9BACT|nr:MAG: hypothetical protein COY43_01685 [Candidatus Berkelbacteria bacterium CG_4_10_14_0_8_um_filter_35_9_33_8]PJA21026.1 MAG: hypothetical protein COX60_00035 [Candidatus Berkelbacteria bacterium CG_4_10_14_0_2_um_filter_35_9_33_12]